MPDNNVYIWVLFVLILLFVALLYLTTRVRQVPEGYMGVLEKMNKFERTVEPGMYLLRPLEEEVKQIYVRQREETVNVPNVMTDGGLFVAVNLRFAYTLDPRRMNSSEIYYPDEERWKQLQTLVKGAFGGAMSRFQGPQAPPRPSVGHAVGQPPTGMPRLAGSRPPDPVAGTVTGQPGSQAGAAQPPSPPPAQSAPPSAPPPGDRADVAAIFSPFAGPKRAQFLADMENAIRDALARHGIIVSPEPIVVNGLVPPAGVIDALVELQSTPFSSTAKADFLRRLSAAAPGLSQATLVQLFNILQGHGVDIHSFISNGMLNPQAFTLALENGLGTVHSVNGAPDGRDSASSQDGAAQGGTAGDKPAGEGAAAKTAAPPPAPETPEKVQAHTPPPPAGPRGTRPAPGAGGSDAAAQEPPQPLIFREPGCDPDYGVFEEDNALVRSTRE